MRHPAATLLCLVLLCPVGPAFAQGSVSQGGASPGGASQGAAAGVSVAQPWARASIGASTTAAAYLSLVSHGAADALTGASTPVAGQAQLHTAGMEGGVMHMRPVDSLPLPPDHAVTLAPGGYHLMLEHLAHPLHRGDTFPLTLRFRTAPPVTVQVVVQGPGAMGTEGAGMGGMDMGGAPHR